MGASESFVSDIRYMVGIYNAFCDKSEFCKKIRVYLLFVIAPMQWLGIKLVVGKIEHDVH